MSSTLVFSTGLSKRAIWPPASCFGSTRPRPHCKIAAGFLPPAATIGWRSTGVLNDRRDCRGLDESPARIAGSLYIIIIVGAVFAPFPVAPSGLRHGDAAVTATKMMASKFTGTVFSWGAAELVVYGCDIGVALIFYELLNPVSRRLTLLAAFFRLAYVGIAGANVLNHFAPLLLMSGGEYLTPFQPDQLLALAVTFIRLHIVGFDIALMFFGFHCIVAGYLSS